MRKHERVCAVIYMDAIAENCRQMRLRMKPETKMTAVIKTDGYGHGAVPIAHYLEDYDYLWGFAVATAEEAFELRENGVKKPILILGYTFSEYYEEFAELDIRPVVFKYDMAEEMSKAATAAGKTMKIHLGLDTGMSRIGFADTEESVEVIGRIAKLPGIEIEGMFTHFAKADEYDKTNAYGQTKRYLEFAQKLENAGITIPIRHCSNSAGILELQDAHLDMVRAGITLYGIYPSDEVDRNTAALQPVMELKSHIVYIKEIEAGTSVSYGGTYTAAKTTRVATIPVGYGDGYPRGLSNKGWVLIHGKKAPILGRVCMDQFMVDVTDIPEAKELDEVTLMGRDGESFLGVDTLGELSGRFPYEFVCDIGKRVPRVYVE